MQPQIIFVVCAVVLVLVSFIAWICSRYKKCPSDKIMVVFGSIGKNKDGTNRSAKCIHGGAEFVVPVFQSYAYLDLTPISIQVDLKNALSRQNIRIDVPSRFTVGISTEPGVMQNAAERLLGLQLSRFRSFPRISSSVSFVLSSLRWISRRSTPTVTSSSRQ
jgi:flotillin